MRLPDKPGTYRVVPRNGKWMLSGVRWNGSRVKVRDLSRVEAEKMGRDIFGGGTPAPTSVIPGVTHKFALGKDGDPLPLGAIPVIDDWGLPIRIKDENVAGLNAAFGIAPPPVVPQQPSAEEEAKRERRLSNAKSLMELGGVTWAMGSVWAGRKLCERTGREAPMPSKTQVKDLQEVTQETLIDFFGNDVGLKPWQLMILLSLGIPFSMFLQARKLPPSEDKKADHLKSVP